MAVARLRISLRNPTWFGDIFLSNSVNCGLLLAQVYREDAEGLSAAISSGGVRLTIDLVSQHMSGETDRNFDIPLAARDKLIADVDRTGTTLQGHCGN